MKKSKNEFSLYWSQFSCLISSMSITGPFPLILNFSLACFLALTSARAAKLHFQITILICHFILALSRIPFRLS